MRAVCPQCGRASVRLSNLIFLCPYCGWQAEAHEQDKLSQLIPVSPSRDVNLRVTDYAWTWLVQTAQAHGYLRAEHNSRNVNLFIDALSQLAYIDMRPIYWRGTPCWWDGEPTQRHLIRLNGDTVDRLIALGELHGIKPYIEQWGFLAGRTVRPTAADTFTGRVARLSPVVQAIAMLYLTTDTIPNAPYQLWATAKRKPKQATIVYGL